MTTVTTDDNLDITGLMYPQFSSTEVEPFSPHVVGPLPPPLEEFTEPVYNQVHQEQIIARETTLNIVENPAVQEHAIVQEHSELQVMERRHEQIVDITCLVNPHFSSFAVEASAPQVVVLLPPFEEFTAPVYNQVYQEQIVVGEMTLNKVENPAVCVAHSAPRRLRSASHHSLFDLAGRDLTEYTMRSSPNAVLLECDIGRVVIETFCYMRLITTQSSNRPREKNLATLL